MLKLDLSAWHPRDLTGKQQSVLKYLFEGAARDVIAKKLKMTSKTVDTHTKSIYSAFGVHSITELVTVISDKYAHLIADENISASKAGAKNEKIKSFLETLIPRETQVIEFLKKGIPTKTIREEMEVSTKTVEAYYYTIRQKAKNAGLLKEGEATAVLVGILKQYDKSRPADTNEVEEKPVPPTQ
jgi:DNA-binding NarL/FixJ family response regulator